MKKNNLDEKYPLVTIVTVVFNLIDNNREKTFYQCVESVSNQDYPNIEHLVIDGGSTDGSLEIIKKKSKKNKISWISEPDDGIYDAMNKGIKLAKGKYISFLNSDDFYHDNGAVKEVVKSIELSKADYSYSKANVVRNNKLVNSHPSSSPNIKNIFNIMPFCHQTMFFKREVLTKNLFDISFKSAADYDLVLRLYLNGFKNVFIRKNFVTYRLDGISDSHQELSVNESNKALYKNFKLIAEISWKDCEEIYGNGFNGIPLKLALKLKEYPDFNFEDYLNNLEKLRKTLNLIKNENKVVKKELQDIYESPSWKIASIIRELAKKIAPRRGFLRRIISFFSKDPNINL